MTTTRCDDTAPTVLSQRTGGRYGHLVPPAKRKTPQRTVGVDDKLWGDAGKIAAKRREKLSDVVRRALYDYVQEHKHLLDDE